MMRFEIIQEIESKYGFGPQVIWYLVSGQQRIYIGSESINMDYATHKNIAPEVVGMQVFANKLAKVFGDD